MSHVKVTSITAIALLVGLVALPLSGLGQQEEEQFFQGRLVQVDAEELILIVENSDEMRMTFAYNAQTEVEGPETTIQGLAQQTGIEVRVAYLAPPLGQRPLARQIAVVEE